MKLGWGPAEVRNLFAQGARWLKGATENHRAWERQLMKDAAATLTTQQSSFTKRDLVRYLAEESQEKGIGADRVLELSKGILLGRNVISLGVVDNAERFSTKKVVSTEKKMMKRVAAMSRYAHHNLMNRTLSKVVAKRPTMTDEQKKALRHATTG